MKAFRLLIILSVILCCLLTLGCNRTPTLSEPTGLEIDATTLTLTWREVKGARMYTVRIEQSGKEPVELGAGKNAYSLESLDPGSYVIKVMANGREDESLDSAWSKEIPFDRETETGLVLTLNQAKTAYEVTGKGEATGDIVIPATYRSKPITSIGKGAFFNKSDVTSVTLGANVQSIGELAFANCSYLTSVSFPEGLTSLGKGCFASCRSLSGKLVIPGGVTLIPENAFAYCVTLEQVHFSQGVVEIGSNAFTDCTGLIAVQFADSVKTVGDYAFANCPQIAAVELGANAEQVGKYAFAGNTAITALVLPDSVIAVGEGAFSNCTALADVTLSAGLQSLDCTAFRNTVLWNECLTNEFYVGNWFLALKDKSATYVNLRPDTYGIADYAFYGNKTLSDLILPDSVRIIGNRAFSQSVLRNMVIGSGVRSIGENAFAGCESLANVVLGSYNFDTQTMTASSLVSIGSYAFMNCTALLSVVMPDSVRTVGTYAFRGAGLESMADAGVVYAGNWVVGFTDAVESDITVRPGTVGIANYAFYKCDFISTVELPSTVKQIGRAAFYDCGWLTSIILPDTLAVIEDYTFYHCDALRLERLPSMLQSIGRSAFYKCGTVYFDAEAESDSDTLTIPDSVKTIGDYAFYGCGLAASMGSEGEVPARGIDIVVIGEGTEHIGANAFYGFVTLKKVVIGNSVRTIGEKAFYRCPALQEVVFGNGLQTIGEKAFYRCPALTAVSLPDSLFEIGAYAFYKCEALSDVDLGAGLAVIGHHAFYGCTAIEALALPVTLTTVGDQAFRNCTGLVSVVLGENITQIGAHAFYGCKGLTVYAERKAAPEGWHLHWNSARRPVVWGCTLSEQKDYVVSLSKEQNSVLNKNASNTLAPPVRKGHTFGGWGSNSSATTASYTAENLNEAPDGRTLYAIWWEDGATN